MAKMMETVLYYNPGRPETMKHVAMMKSVLVRMGVRIRNIGPEQVMEYRPGSRNRDTEADQNRRNGEMPADQDSRNRHGQ